MTMIRRYEFTCQLSVFAQNLVDALKDTDPYWGALYSTNTDYANWGNAVLTNKKAPKMRFTISMYAHSWGVSIRWGMVNDGEINPKPDLWVSPPSGVDKFQTETPLMCYSSQYNIKHKWTVITNEGIMFLHGEVQDYHTYGYPVRIFLGQCQALEKEDPAIADKFYGIFPHMPFALNHDDYADQYDTSRGFVRTSRNGTPNQMYNFGTESLPSPGVGKRYYVTPFMVYHPQEGVRGEFKGMSSIVFKDGAQHPDGSILDLGVDGIYYVFHVVDQNYPNQDQGRYYYHSGGSRMSSRPKFFHGAQLLGGGQRALLFKI
ncbi:hypothetical protein P4V86_03405 [Brevibacillus laterosporus]|uniref:hypothetical protein n=1 Tax=Brevibacillus laterosporus TaxID=1465 RepID=UPI000374C616|nr:hypothetical protein [Brevibacillus laterosporus]ATO48569.1 hypothetical protein BrL25_05235 [Brevibacillus laterosporus DSM 25]MED2002405.1 hypothetical protein [Brevibacillus laterosporus]